MQRLTFILHGTTMATTCSDADAAKVVDTLSKAWLSGQAVMICVGAEDETGPMHINTAAVQGVQLNAVQG